MVPGSSCFCKYTFLTYVNFMSATPMFGMKKNSMLKISKKILPIMPKNILQSYVFCVDK